MRAVHDTYYYMAGLHFNERHYVVDPNLLRHAICEDIVYMATNIWKSVSPLLCTPWVVRHTLFLCYAVSKSLGACMQCTCQQLREGARSMMPMCSVGADVNMIDTIKEADMIQATPISNCYLLLALCPLRMADKFR
jgi:hypothetical protein